MDIFDRKEIKPMLISQEKPPFDSDDYIFELKLDGIRCIAYLDKNEAEIRNKRNKRLSTIFPELNEIHKQVNKKCILDGELIVTINGKPEFSEVQRRALMSNKFKIDLSVSKSPASFVAYDILYYDNIQIIDKVLMERKKLLENTVIENERIAISRYIEGKGIDLYQLTVQQNLEGIVAKKKDSKYYFNKRTKDWIKVKNLLDDDYVICGYILKSKGITSLILGQYDKENLVYRGHVTLGISSQDFLIISNQKRLNNSPFKEVPKNHDNAIWIEPTLVGTVKFMSKSDTGFLRQPVFKGLRKDKLAKQCTP